MDLLSSARTTTCSPRGRPRAHPFRPIPPTCSYFFAARSIVLWSSISPPRCASSAHASAPPFPRHRIRIQSTPSRPRIRQSSAAAPVHRSLPLPASGSSRLSPSTFAPSPRYPRPASGTKRSPTPPSAVSLRASLPHSPPSASRHLTRLPLRASTCALLPHSDHTRSAASSIGIEPISKHNISGPGWKPQYRLDWITCATHTPPSTFDAAS
jgi:hypothetical protein